jgi:hypothetical protein
MRRHCGSFRLHVLAMGTEVATWARAQADVACTTVDELLERHPHLRPDLLPGPPRLRVDELLCTWRWWFGLDLVRELGEGVLAVDADGMFWSSPEPVFEEIGEAGFAVLPHGLARAADGFPGVTVETHGVFGLYNGGFVYLRDPAPAAALAEYVREWCYAGWRTHEDGRRTFGDQGYLELVLERFGGHVIEHPGARAAPWNVNLLPLRETHDGRVFIGGKPVIFFHYQGYRPEARSHAEYATNDEHDRILYVPYRAALAAEGA